MSKNYITDNQELEVFENYLKCLSEEFQKEYREEGKYLYIGLAVELGMTTLLPFIFSFDRLYTTISKCCTQYKSNSFMYCRHALFGRYYSN